MLLDGGRNVCVVSKVVRLLVQGVRLQASCVELEVTSVSVYFTPTLFFLAQNTTGHGDRHYSHPVLRAAA